jgi:hypothetical protein
MEPPSLNYLNYLNVGAFVITWLLNSELDFGPDNEFFNFLNGMRELGRRYESVVTPEETTFLIAHLTLLFEGIFTTIQLLPAYRATPLVQDGVHYWFFASVVAQLFWCMGFGLENIFGAFLSVAFMGAMLYSLSQILLRQANMTELNQTPEEYWLLRFPFSLHTGWTMAVFVMSINGFFTAVGVNSIVLLIIGVLSLAAYVGIAYKMLFANGDHPNYAIPSVIAWVTLGIALGARAPGMEDFGEIVIMTFTVFAGIVGLSIAGVTGYLFYTNEVADCMSNSGEDEEKEGTSYVPASEPTLA